MKPHWLDRPGARRHVWIAFVLVLAAVVLAQLFIDVTPHFAMEAWFAFSAVFGFVACVVLVAVAKLIGVLLERSDDYYGDRDA